MIDRCTICGDAFSEGADGAAVVPCLCGERANSPPWRWWGWAGVVLWLWFWVIRNKLGPANWMIGKYPALRHRLNLQGPGA